MSIDDVGTCRVCGLYHLKDAETFCSKCLQRAIDKASNAKTVGEALEIIRWWLLESRR
ncbi:MAG: hypothetical protein DDT32_02283 [Syntrophomonadaceae bacterium]|nr:hypothetical protein [Bacillota bacterium]